MRIRHILKTLEIVFLLILGTAQCLLGQATKEEAHLQVQTLTDVEKRITVLRQEIAYHDFRYYQLNDPEISDTEYDALVSRLKALEAKYPELSSNDSPSKQVGYGLSSNTESVQHRIPMLSLESTRSFDAIRAFDERCRKLLNINGSIEYVVELKYDGLAVELHYLDGRFSQGSTRGDGEVGERVTENLLAVKGFPRLLKESGKAIPQDIEIRGEVYMSIADFETCNRQREQLGEKPFVSPRNAAAGSLRLENPAETAQRGLGIYCYGIGYAEPGLFVSQWQMLEQFVAWGLPVHEKRQLCDNIEAVLAFCEAAESERAALNLEIDGVVIKVNSLAYQEQLGIGRTSPHWALAYKFSPREAVTVLKDIIVQVGRTGVLTPVAVLEPVHIGGAEIERASLHNFDNIQNKDLRLGDTVLIQRAGDVIPDVVKSLQSYRGGDETIFPLPQKCPSCGEAVYKTEPSVALRCLNQSCPAQLVARLTHFASRDAMAITGLGPKLAKLLVDSGNVETVADLYALKVEELEALQGVGQKSAGALLAAIEASKERPLGDCIYGLGIPEMGRVRAEVLANKVGSIEDLLSMDVAAINEMYDLGPSVRSSLITYLKEPSNTAQLKRLSKMGIGAYSQKIEISGYTFFTEKIVVFTGALNAMSRKEAKARVVALGGYVTSNVSGKTDILVVGLNPGAKLKKATQLGVKVLNEIEFLQKIE